MEGIGKTIRQLRHQKGWSQADAALRLNISIPAYSKIETGITDINLSRLQEIAELYEVSVAGLLSLGKDDVEVTQQSQLNALNEKLRLREADVMELQQKLIRLYDDLKNLAADRQGQ